MGLRLKIIFLSIVILLAAFGVGQWLEQSNDKNINRTIINSDCNPTKNSCVIEDVNFNYTLYFKDEVSTLVPFIVNIDVAEKQPQAIDISFEMVGMAMGFNQYHLVKEEKAWQTKVILPVCSLGRNDWLLNVKLKLDNIESVTQFKFSH